MIRTVTFIAIMFVMAYGLYVFPFVALAALFAGHAIFQPWSLVPALLVLFLIRLYFVTSITNKVLKAFVYYGMGAGFISLWVTCLALAATLLPAVDDRSVAMVAVAATLCLTVSALVNGSRVTIKTLGLTSTKISKTVRLVFISDVHVGSNSPRHLERICEKIRHHNADALLIGGDLFDSSDFSLEDLQALGALDMDIFFITGNHEGYVKGYQQQLDRFKELNITVLDNERAALGEVNLIGVADEQSPGARAKTVERLNVAGAFNLALVHQPSIWDQTARYTDLMLCGHTHKGQIFPFNFLVRLQFRHVFGLYGKPGAHLYVSSGAGCWGPRMRLGSRNEIIFLDIHPESPQS
ncbi:MAG: metallophosphoesterase [Alphaproteobacteria bacterium]|nr:metallophosphoesterase [Alphaproteobacteria bacterium]